MAKSYVPRTTPDPDAWQSMDEDERRMAVEAYHRKSGIKLPNALVHA